MSEQIEKIAVELKKYRKSTGSKNYPKEIRNQVIALMEEGVSRKDIADVLQIHPTTLAGWKNKNRLSSKKDFQQATIVDDNPDIKVTVISGLKLTDLSKFF